MRNKQMGMLLQDPSVPDLHQEYLFSLETDYLAGMGSSKLTVRDADEWDNPLYQGLDWANTDLSFATMNVKGDFIDNPQFHQVNVFAVAAHTLELVERAIGREMKWKNNAPLVIRPHAFNDANAYYDPMSPSLNFGSFNSPFRRAPIWTCLSHDVVTHELGHAILDSFRPDFIFSEEVDTGALHESFGDLVALFAALSHKPVVERLFAESGGDMMNPNLTSGLAEEFGIGLWGVSFPFLRSALKGPNYDEAPWEIHDRSTVWTAALYEILATLVKQALSPEVMETLSSSPTTNRAAVQMDIMQQAPLKQPRAPEFEAFYAQPEVRSNFDTFYDAIVKASERVKGMMLRALQDVPPTGVTLLTLARVLYNADARLFPDDANPREVAKEVFQRRMLWSEDIDLSAPGGLGPLLEEPAHAGNAALMQAVYENADALRIPLGEGARILNARVSTVSRTLDAAGEQRGAGTKSVTERYLYFTYETLQESCFPTPDGGFAMGMVSILKGGTLVMDEDWNDIQLATDPDLWITPEEDEGDIPPEGDSVGARMVRRAKNRFVRINRRALRAYRDGLVDAHGHLPSGELALPFKVVRQSSGAGRLIRHRCHLKEHLLGIAGKHGGFPFKVD